jgi:hypothetical protein
MSGIGLAVLGIVWVITGLISASWLTRSNQARGVQRYVPIESHTGGVFLLALILGPVGFPVVGVLRLVWENRDAARARADRERKERRREESRARRARRAADEGSREP